MAKVGWAVIAVIVVSAVFSFWQEHRAERTLAAMQKLLPQQVQALRDGHDLKESGQHGTTVLIGDPMDVALAEIGLGVERPDRQAMRRPPRPPRERLLNWLLALRAYLFLGLMEAAACMAAFFFVLLSANGTTGSPWRRPTRSTFRRRRQR